MIKVNQSLNTITVQTDDTQGAAKLADKIELWRYQVSEIRYNRFTHTAMLIVVDNDELGIEHLKYMLREVENNK